MAYYISFPSIGLSRLFDYRSGMTRGEAFTLNGTANLWKYSDGYSEKQYQSLMISKVFSEAVLTDQDSWVDTWQLHMQNAVITGFADDGFMESIVVNYDKAYWKQK